MSVVFIDCETTGLDPERHHIWEIALIVDDEVSHWLIDPPLDTADPAALQIGRFYERRSEALEGWGRAGDPNLAAELVVLTANHQLAGINPAFDVAFLDRLIRRGGLVPAWHYHAIDVKALAFGYLEGELRANKLRPWSHGSDPWSTDTLAEGLGLAPEQFDRHTALGDARLAKAMYEAVIR